MSESCPQIWSVELQATKSSPAQVVDVSLDEAQRILSNTSEALPDLQAWRYEFVICGSLQTHQRETYDRLTSRFKCIMPHNIDSRDTIEFNLHVDPEDDLGDQSKKAPSRTYSVTDNIFNVYWTYYPSLRTTRGLIIYTTSEAASQASHVLRQLPKYVKYRSWPLLPALLALQAEVVAMRPRIDSQSNFIRSLQLLTGYHNYGSHLSDSENPNADPLQTLKRAGVSVAGATMNVYWLQCIVQLARFVADETDVLIERDRPTETYVLIAGGSMPGLEWLDVVPQLKDHIASWRRSSEALLREAEHWKEKGNLVLQAVSALVARGEQRWVDE